VLVLVVVLLLLLLLLYPVTRAHLYVVEKALNLVGRPSDDDLLLLL
jgi:hypothetical protein